jgi:hypothetical protein
MRNIEHWIPTKFVYKNNKLKANRDTRYVWLCSRLYVDLVAEIYDKNIT